jgi:hypothetical protein
VRLEKRVWPPRLGAAAEGPEGPEGPGEDDSARGGGSGATAAVRARVSGSPPRRSPAAAARAQVPPSETPASRRPRPAPGTRGVRRPRPGRQRPRVRTRGCQTAPVAPAGGGCQEHASRRQTPAGADAETRASRVVGPYGVAAAVVLPAGGESGPRVCTAAVTPLPLPRAKGSPSGGRASSRAARTGAASDSAPAPAPAPAPSSSLSSSASSGGPDVDTGRRRPIRSLEPPVARAATRASGPVVQRPSIHPCQG